MRPSITKLLVASRGATARRVIRTAREMGIATVAVFTEADRHARFVAEADEAVALDRCSDRGDGAYRDGPALVEAARRAGADGVHPGAGALAADPGFAWRCAEAGLCYAGPSPEALAALGSRLEARTLAAGAGVPVLEAEEVEGYPPGKLEAAAEVLGWPVAVKASPGTGGRGLRRVAETEDLAAAVEAVRQEARAAFGDPTVFLEPWLEPARRIDVQVVADRGGRHALLFDREGSLARRFRPVIEEAPTPKLAPPVRERLAEATAAVVEASGFSGAGTVEFLVAGEEFWFLGFTPRLTPGHALTEAILGLDLVRLQLAVAEGRPVPVEARHCSPSGYAVGAHLHATGLSAGDLRSLRRFEIDPAPGIRVEPGLSAGAAVSPDDAELALIVAHGGSRMEAVLRLGAALEGLRVHGVATNREELLAALRHPDFQAGEIDTGFLDRLPPESGVSPRGGPHAVRLHAVAAAVAGRPHPSSGSMLFLGPDGRPVEVRWRLGPDGAADVAVDGDPLPGLRLGATEPRAIDEWAVDVELDGLRRRVVVARTGAVVDCDSRLGHTELVLQRVCEER